MTDEIDKLKEEIKQTKVRISQRMGTIKGILTSCEKEEVSTETLAARVRNICDRIITEMRRNER